MFSEENAFKNAVSNFRAKLSEYWEMCKLFNELET